MGPLYFASHGRRSRCLLHRPGLSLVVGARTRLRRLRHELSGSLEIEYVMSGMRRGARGSRRSSQCNRSKPARAAGCRSMPGAGSSIRHRARTPRASPFWPPPSRLTRRPICAACERACSAVGASSTTPMRSWPKPRRSPAIDPSRFRIDLGSHALLERFGADLERAKAVDPSTSRRRGRPRQAALIRVPGRGGSRPRRVRVLEL